MSDRLKKAIEELSENEVERCRILKKVEKFANKEDLAHINSLPVLYRIELKKALEEAGRSILASDIKS